MGEQLGKFVKARREELEMTRSGLAAKSGVSYPYLSQIETGDREPGLTTMRRLAEGLELPVEKLAALTTGDSWIVTREGTPRSSGAARSRRSEAAPDPLAIYRDRVLPSIERRLASVPPLERISLLNELTAKAAAELAAEQPRPE